MNVLYERCCGIDVHKNMIVACLINGSKHETRKFGTTSDELRSLSQWLLEQSCEMIAMESTASYWKPLYNIFEQKELKAIVVNAQHMKTLPGRKTDIQDAAWIADLLQHGLLKASFIPCREQRELREISRYYKSLICERTREYNRLQKMLEGANIKLSSYVSEINGKASRQLIQKLIEEVELDEKGIQELMHGSMKASPVEMMKAMDGFMTKLQRQLLRSILSHIDDMSNRIDEIDHIMKAYQTEYEDAISLLDEIPGIDKVHARTILAEIGLDMGRFPSAAHLCSWAGVSPGNNESAGKRKSGRTTKGNLTLKTTLVQAAKAAAHKKTSFCYAQYQRISSRRGKNKATVAVAHTILIAIYHILKENVPYHDLGADYYNQFNKEKKINFYLRKLTALGFELPATASS